MGASTRGLKATLTIVARVKSTVVHCVCVVGLTCRNVSSKLSDYDGMLCSTEIRLALGEPVDGGSRLATAGA